jgi:hypothetical protein
MRSPAVIATALACLACLADPRPAVADTINQRVVRFARAHLGRQVGDGECWTLADQALRFAGARRPGRRGYGTYVFGRRIPATGLLPGDILQMERVRFEHRGAGGRRSWQEFGHHTAIVVQVRGTELTILHQNFNGSRAVQRTTIDLDDRVRGSVVFYRPQRR